MYTHTFLERVDYVSHILKLYRLITLSRLSSIKFWNFRKLRKTFRRTLLQNSKLVNSFFRYLALKYVYKFMITGKISGYSRRDFTACEMWLFRRCPTYIAFTLSQRRTVSRVYLHNASSKMIGLQDDQADIQLYQTQFISATFTINLFFIVSPLNCEN